jgi:hypothetical protein
VRLAGVGAMVQGFPDTSANARLDVDLPFVSPFLSFTRTTFKLGDPRADSTAAGVLIDVWKLDLEVSAERTAQRGRPDLKTVTVGGSARF